MSLDQRKTPSTIARTMNQERMNHCRELLDDLQQRLIDKQKLFEIQRDDIQQGINQSFHRIFEQLIEMRRFCRNDIEQQSLNAQVYFPRQNHQDHRSDRHGIDALR